MLNPEKSKKEKFFCVPKQLQKQLLHNSVRDAILAFHFEITSSEEGSFQAFNTAICLLGFNVYSNEIDNKLENQLYKTLQKHRICSFEDYKNIDVLATCVIKSWKKTVKMYNLKPCQENEN